MAEAFELTSRDVVVDIGCGTGQLTLSLARRVRAVVGMDPEPDMLALARRAAGAANLLNTSWVLGADTDVPALAGCSANGRWPPRRSAPPCTGCAQRTCSPR